MPAWLIPAGRAPGRSSCTGSTAIGKSACGSPPPCIAAGPPSAADQLPRRPRRPVEPRRLPPHGPDRVARPGGGGHAMRSRTAPDGSILVGYSMGGALVTRFMEESAPAPARRGAWSSTLRSSTGSGRSSNSTPPRMGLPGFLATPVEWADRRPHRRRTGACLTPSTHRTTFHLPILLFHGEDDDVVPIETSDDLAAELPRWVTYYRGAAAAHTRELERRPAALRTAPRGVPRNVPGNRSSPTEVGLEVRRTGGDLLSQEVALQVPSALRGLTALFGMGRGVSPSLCATGNFARPAPVELENCTRPKGN